jgi:hypothetical protein
VRKIAHRVIRGRDEPEDVLCRAFRRAWLYGGLPFLMLTALIIAAQRAPGFADFLYGLGVVWIAFVRYAEFGCQAKGSLQPSRTGLRQWRRFLGVLAAAAAVLYSLAKVVAGPGGS